MRRDADRACAQLAEGQRGYLSTAQAIACGLSPSGLSRRVASGALIVVYPGVLRLPGVPDSWEGRLTAALLSCGSGSFVSHRSAGALWELDGVEPGFVEISAYLPRRRRGVIVHRLRRGDRPGLRFRYGFPVTSVERTILDLCGTIGPQRAGLAVDDALRKRMTILDRLWDVWESDGGSGRKGTRAMRTVLGLRDDRDGLLQSKMETRMLRILKRIEPDKLVPQFVILDGSRTYRPDFAYPYARLGIECLSIKWHLGVEWIKKDAARDRRLKLLGWTILYFTWDEIFLEPERVEVEVRAALARFSQTSPENGNQ